jgi:transposase-like protein
LNILRATGGKGVPDTKQHDYSLDKSTPIAHNPAHEDKPHFFLGLAAEADARNCLRKSFFIDANNFRVGTLRSASSFSFSDGVRTMTLPDVTELFDTDEKCRELLERLRWPNGPECPRCHTKTLARLDARLLYCKDCDYQFTVTAGTIFHDSHLPLATWFMVTLLLCEARKGISANQIRRTIWGQHKGSYKTAWYLCHRIRAAMSEAERPMLDGTVEMDETYVGGKQHNRGRGRATTNKEVVIGIRQRGGDVRFFHAEDARKGTLAKYIRENISTDVDVIVTDELPAYKSAVGEIKHETVNHSAKEYVRLGTDIHTNTVESAFSLLKRGIIGSWHKISAKHLAAYLAEMEFRFNRRKSPALFLDTLRHMITAPVLTFEKLTA